MRLTKLVLLVAFLASSTAVFSSRALAGLPSPLFSTCTVTITQFPTRLQCMTSFEPDVVRLTPAGSNAAPQFDRVSITVRVRDVLNNPYPFGLVVFIEADPSDSRRVNIANGGSTTSMTDATGLATVLLNAASGSGLVWLCADGVQLCALEVRSPDVSKGGTPMLCGLGTGPSTVAVADMTNPVCGFVANFGPVTPGVNNGFDLDCNGAVAAGDISGSLGKGGFLQYFGDSGVLGSKNSCALP